MKKETVYEVPMIEIIEVEVEKGFANSDTATGGGFGEDEG